MSLQQHLSQYIREVPDFPKPGILFRDISPLLESPQQFRDTIDQLAAKLDPTTFDAIAGIESRGFIFGSALATKMGKGFIPIRKKGKLPPPVERVSYDLEYGQDILEMRKGTGRILIVDDVLATGGTLKAAIDLSERAGYEIVDICVLINLRYLNRFRWKDREIQSLLQYDAT